MIDRAYTLARCTIAIVITLAIGGLLFAGLVAVASISQ